ncbi:MAG: ElyC/SanA/YdcF family protein, partial [Thermoleophilia bacterium]
MDSLELALAIAASTLVGVPLAALALTSLRIHLRGRTTHGREADVIVVFGAAVRADLPSPELGARLRHAASLYQQGHARTILCSGGHPGPGSEARVMRSALVALGVPEQAILIEETGSSTRRTVEAVERLSHGRWRRILVVSSPYHLYRIEGEARRRGLPVAGSAPPATPLTTRLRPRVRAHLREVAAVWWYALTPRPRDRPTTPPGDPAPAGAPTDRLAVVVLSLANEPHLVDAVRSVLAQDPRPEVVVVNSAGGDPGSTLRAAGLDVPLVDVRERLLPGGARNRGIAATSAPLVAFLAADCIAEPGWAAARIAAHEAGADAVAGVLTPARPRTRSACASHLRLHHRARPEAPDDDRVLAMLSYRRELLERQGPFLEDVLVGEDTDYLDRLAPEHVVAVATGARTAHRYPLTVRALLVDQHRRGRAAVDHLLTQGDRRARLAVPRRNLANVGLALARARAVPEPEERRALLRATPLLLVGALACAL